VGVPVVVPLLVEHRENAVEERVVPVPALQISIGEILDRL
jgi:hypothetical protein